MSRPIGYRDRRTQRLRSESPSVTIDQSNRRVENIVALMTMSALEVASEDFGFNEEQTTLFQQLLETRMQIKLKALT